MVGLAALAAVTKPALAEGVVSTAINVAAVNNYQGCGATNLSNSIADITGFRDGMTQSGSIFTKGNSCITGTTGYTCTDAQANSRDFYDPQLTGGSGDDWFWFDASYSAISYFTGHGNVNNGSTLQACSSSASCTSPPSGTTFPSFCLTLPGDWPNGRCNYTKFNRALLAGNCTSVFYGSGGVSWGESSYSGAWRGAGTDGGTNLVVLHISDASLSRREQEIFPAYGGVHMILTTMVHSGDTANISERGANFAARYRANSYSGVAYSWGDALNSNRSSGSRCKNLAGTQIYGGGFGFNGCGAQEAISMDSNATSVDYHIQGENWHYLQINTTDATGNAWWESSWTCNWDCVTYPMSS